jgi:Ca2+-transporting ATPase
VEVNPMAKNFHHISLKEVFSDVNSSSKGLTKNEAKKRLADYGLNKIKEMKKKSTLKMFIEQFTSILVLVLIFGGLVSFLIGETIDATAIFVIVILNGIVGFIQEYKAEKSIEALKKLESLKARVLRDGKEIEVHANELVPGDIIFLSEGDKIPADARIIESMYLEVDESLLTGESRPVAKKLGVLKEKIPLGDQKNMVFSGTLITRGHGKAVVVRTGMDTEIGKIAHIVQTTEEKMTPLQLAMDKLGKMLAILCIVIFIPGFIIGYLKGMEMTEVFMLAVALAVSAIPEGLAIVVTIALAFGVRKMAKRNALVRKLPTVEALGSVDVICSDKTGTITHNKMTVVEVVTPTHGLVNITGEGYVTDGKFIKQPGSTYNIIGTTSKKKSEISKEKICEDEELSRLLKIGILCSDSELKFGDPTERSLLYLAEKAGFNYEEIRKENKRVDEVPFESANKYMISLNHEDHSKKLVSSIKGAPEVITKYCDYIYYKGKKIKLTEKTRKKMLKINDNMSSRGYRVLALAYKEVKKKGEFKKLSSFVFVGFVGMEDPPRKEVKDAIKICKKAHVRVLMITGDHKLTAKSIAEKIGLKSKKVLTGIEIDQIPDEDFKKVVEEVNVFARVSPQNKVRILEALQSNGHIVAMTGDGVNDAPALRKANIGVAVGSGSDLTKEISNLILLDDNFSTIQVAIEEGRRIFFNIKKFLKFLLCANFDEILEVTTVLFTGLPLPYLPIQILWLNLVTDSPPALALSVDVADPDIMEKKPYDPTKEITRGLLKFTLVAGFIDYVSTMILFLSHLYIFKVTDLDYIRTLCFSNAVFYEFFVIFSMRHEKSAFKAGIFSNKLLWVALFAGIFLQLAVIYLPFLQPIFHTVPLGFWDWVKVLSTASMGFVLIESYRFIKNRKSKKGKD